MIRSFLIRTITLTCILALTSSSAPFAYGWAAGNPEAGPDADNGSTGTAQGGSGPAGPGPGQGGGEGGAPTGSSGGSNSTGSSGSGTGGGYSEGYGAGDYSYGPTGNGSGSGGGGGGFGVGNNPDGSVDGGLGEFGGPGGDVGAQRSSISDVFSSRHSPFNGNENSVSVQSAQAALNAATKALSEAEFNARNPAPPQTTSYFSPELGRPIDNTIDQSLNVSVQPVNAPAHSINSAPVSMGFAPENEQATYSFFGADPTTGRTVEFSIGPVDRQSGKATVSVVNGRQRTEVDQRQMISLINTYNAVPQAPKNEPVGTRERALSAVIDYFAAPFQDNRQYNLTIPGTQTLPEEQVTPVNVEIVTEQKTETVTLTDEQFDARWDANAPETTVTTRSVAQGSTGVNAEAEATVTVGLANAKGNATGKTGTETRGEFTIGLSRQEDKSHTDATSPTDKTESEQTTDRSSRNFIFGPVNPDGAKITPQNVVNLNAPPGSEGTAEYNGQKVRVTGPTSAITGLSGAVDYSEEDVETLGRALAGEVRVGIKNKIVNGRELTDEEIKEAAVTVNTAVTRALANAGSTVGGYQNGSVAGALKAGDTENNKGQYSAFNKENLRNTNESYAQNPGAYNEMARKFLDGEIAKERGTAVAVPLPRATHYYNPGEATPNWGPKLQEVREFGPAGQSHRGGTLAGEYETRGQPEGLEKLALDRFNSVMGAESRGMDPVRADEEGQMEVAKRLAFGNNGEFAGTPGGSGSPEPSQPVTQVDAEEFSETFDGRESQPQELGGIPTDRSLPETPPNAFTFPDNVFDFDEIPGYIGTEGPRAPAGSFRLGATGLAEAEQRANLTESFKHGGRIRDEDPDTTVNGLTLGQVAQIEVANYNEKHGTRHNVDVYSGKGPHGSARHRDHDDTARGTPGCGCAIDFSITDENGRALPVSGNEDVYAEVARGLVEKTGGSIGLGAEYMDHGIHFDMANIAHPNKGAFAGKEWGSLGKALAKEFAELRAGAPKATVEYDEETGRTTITLPTEDVPFDQESTPGIASGIFGIDPNESRFVDPNELDEYVEEQQRTAEPAEGEPESDTEPGDSIRERATEQVRDFIRFISDLLGGRGDRSPSPTDGENATTTDPVSYDTGDHWLSALTLTPTAHAQVSTPPEESQSLKESIAALWHWIFGSEEAPRRTFSDLPGAHLHAYSRPYVPVLVQIDEVAGAVKFSRGEIKNATDVRELPEALEIAFESGDDSFSLILNEFGDVVYSNGMFAPETDTEGNPLPTDMDYVYFVEYWRDGELVRSETNTKTLPGNFFTRMIGDLFSKDDPFTLTDVDSVTFVHGDPDPDALTDDYREYTIRLMDGSVRHVSLPVNSSLSFYLKELDDIGYNGDIVALLNIATETERKEGVDAKGFLARSLSKLNGDSVQSDALPDQQQEIFSDLTEALSNNQGGFIPSGVTEVVVYFNVPVLCEDETTTGYVYEVTLSGYQPNGALTEIPAAAARCGNGGPRTYATEIAAHITSATGLAVSDEQILELIEFQYNTPEYVYLNDEGDASASAPVIPNTTNEVVFEAKASRNGATVVNWSTGAITLAVGDQLHLRWNAENYQRCLPFIADNGAYSLSRNDLRLVSGNTEAEGYDLTERTGTYRVECDGQLNGENGVDERRIEVRIQ
ncbi:MAG: hypothetical protein WDZ93_01330 [Candidatus Paceibacterota bacterium]